MGIYNFLYIYNFFFARDFSIAILMLEDYSLDWNYDPSLILEKFNFHLLHLF